MAQIYTATQETTSEASKVVQGVLRNDKDLSAYLGGASCELLLMLRNLGLPFHKFGKTRFYFPNEIDEWIRTHGEKNNPNDVPSIEGKQEITNGEQQDFDEIPEQKHININFGKRY